MRDWSKPQRQSGAALVIQLLKAARAIAGGLFPVLIGVFLGFKKSGKFWPAIIALMGIIALLSLILSLVRYLYFRFYITDNQLVILKGLFAKKRISIPLEKIQSVHFEQQFWNTLTGTTRVLIDTPGTEQTEATIDALGMADAEAFRIILLSHKQQESVQEINQTPAETLLIRTSIAELAKLSLTANHLKTLGLILGFLISRLNDASEIFNLEAWDWLESNSGNIDPGWKMISVIAVISLLISVLFSIAGTILKYFNMEVRHSPAGFSLKWGLIQIKQAVLPIKKIQIIFWRNNFVRKQLGIYLMKLQSSSGHAFKDEDSKSISNVKLPVFSDRQVREMTSIYMQHHPSTETEGNGISKAYVHRNAIIIAVCSLIASAVAFFWIGWHALWILIIAAYGIPAIMVYRKKFRFWINENGIIIHRGIWGNNYSLFGWEKIQFISMNRSLYQRRKGLANIEFHTAGGSIKLPFIRKVEADSLMDYAIHRVESGNKNWM